MTTTSAPIARRSTSDEIRVEALHLLLSEASAAATAGDTQRFDDLITRLLSDGRAESTDEPSDHEKRMDRWRVATTATMISALFLIIVLVSFNSRAGNNAVQYVSLFSGLAGIALGWLFGAGSTTLRRNLPLGASAVDQSRRPSARRGTRS